MDFQNYVNICGNAIAIITDARDVLRDAGHEALREPMRRIISRAEKIMSAPKKQFTFFTKGSCAEMEKLPNFSYDVFFSIQQLTPDVFDANSEKIIALVADMKNYSGPKSDEVRETIEKYGL